MNAKFGQAEIWCWIDSEFKAYQLAYYIVTWIIVILNTIFVVLLIWNLKQLNCNDEMIKRYINKLKLYPIIQIVSLIPATINRIMYYFYDIKNIFWMAVLQIIFDSLTGLIFSIVYGFNPNVRTIIYDFMERICSKKKNVNPLDKENSFDDSASIDHPNRYRNDSLKSYQENVLHSQEGDY